MNRVRFNYWKLTALVAVLAMSLIPSVRPSRAKNQPSPVATAAPDADLVNEDRVLAKYFDDLFAYHKQAAQLSKKGTLLSADLDPLQRQSDDLKRRLPDLQSVISEMVIKLK